MPGLTTEEKEEGRKAKEALEEEAGGDGEDGEGGNYKGKSQFFTHLKKSEVRHTPVNRGCTSMLKHTMPPEFPPER